MTGKIYITFNSNNKTHIEESTALRLQTLSNLYGISVNLPYKATLNFEDDIESKNRIQKSDYVVVLSMTNLSPRLKSEIDYSINQNKPIIIIYDKAKGKNLKLLNQKNIKEVELDAYNSEDTLNSIADYLANQSPATKKQSSNTKIVKSSKANGESIGVAFGIALLGIGLGLLALALLSSDEKR